MLFVNFFIAVIEILIKVPEFGFIISVIIAVSAAVTLSITKANKREAEYQEYINQKVYDLVNKTKITPKEFFELRNLSVGKNSGGKIHNFPGVYVVYNHK